MRYLIGKFEELPLYFTFKCYDIKKGVQAFLDYYKFKNYNDEKPLITITPFFLFYPKYYKKFILWHEYGHYMMKLDGEKIKKENPDLYAISDALAEFYACCKYKIHFNEYCKMLFRNKKINKDFCIVAENKYNIYINNNYDISLSLINNVNDIVSLVYIFYRNKNILNYFYDIMFNDYSLKNEKFNWNDFLETIGWDKDDERWKYINYNLL
jgi:hypothetical protein